MKKLFLLWLWCMTGSTMINAQNNPFEGEIVYECFEQHPDLGWKPKKKTPNPNNGVHRYKCLMKGSKIHVIDETTGVHRIMDTETEQNVHFIPTAKMGIDYEKAAGTEHDYGMYPFGANPTGNTYKKKESTQTILNHPCTLYEGHIKGENFKRYTVPIFNQVITIDATTTIKGNVKAYESNNIIAPTCCKALFQGVDVKNVPLKLILKIDKATTNSSSSQVVSQSTYLEFDAVQVTPRIIDDNEFEVPFTYDIFAEKLNWEYFSSSNMKALKRFRKFSDEFEKHKAADDSQKSTGVHYRTGEEWNF